MDYDKLKDLTYEARSKIYTMSLQPTPSATAIKYSFTHSNWSPMVEQISSERWTCCWCMYGVRRWTPNGSVVQKWVVEVFDTEQEALDRRNEIQKTLLWQCHICNREIKLGSMHSHKKSKKHLQNTRKKNRIIPAIFDLCCMRKTFDNDLA